MKEGLIAYLSRSPITLLIILVSVVFLSEMGVMTFLIPFLPPAVASLVDAALLVIILFPVLTFFVLRPLILQIRERRRAEEEVRRLNEELEQRVIDRTAELAKANKELMSEIEERKRSEKALRESESKFRRLSEEFNALLNGISDPLSLISSDLKILWANKGAAATAGKEVSDLTGNYCYSVWHKRSSPCEICPVVKSLNTGKAEIARIETPQGGQWELKAFPLKDEEGRVSNVLTVASSITEQMRFEAEASRVAHLASLGELAAGVAHEINNPINGIINYAQMLINRSEKGGKEREIASSILREGDRVANIIRSLLFFARSGRKEKNPARVQDILSDSLALSATQLRKEGIALTLDVPPDLPAIIAHPQQIEQVFLNLISNARYALNQKYPAIVHRDKILRILGEKATVDGRICVRIIFHDQGVGIPAGIIDKVMNPFFSTKPKGTGTGLGLSISHGIIVDHEGSLRIESAEGEFTKVIVELPAAEEKKH